MTATRTEESLAPRRAPGPTRRAVLAAGAVALAVAVIVLGCMTLAAGPGTTQAHGHGAAAAGVVGEDSADAGFARDMQIHHAQAVNMAMQARDRSTDPAVRTLAYDIALTQQEQIGQMHGWLASWGLPQTGRQAPMTWMHPMHDHGGHDHATGGTSPAPALATPMPGMATTAELQAWALQTGTPADITFLQMMIRHHQAGVDMAQAAVDHAQRPEVQTLAAAMVAGQQSEIDQMQTMIEQREAGTP